MDILGLSVPDAIFLALWLVCALAIPLVFAPELTSLIQRGIDHLPRTGATRVTGRALYRAMMFVLACIAAVIWLTHAGNTGTDGQMGVAILGLSIPDHVFIFAWLMCAFIPLVLYAPEIASLLQRGMDRLPDVLSGRINGKTLCHILLIALFCSAILIALILGDMRNASDRAQSSDRNVWLLGTAGNDRLQGQAGDDIISGRKGDDRLAAGRGNDRLHGGRGADRLRGGPGDDRLKGGRGDDILDGGKGDDTLRGGPGRDRFVFRGPLFGHDTVEDFTQGQDVLRFSGQKLRMSDMRVEQIDSNTVITINGFPSASVTLIGVDAGLLSDADFIFD